MDHVHAGAEEAPAAPDNAITGPDHAHHEALPNEEDSVPAKDLESREFATQPADDDDQHPDVNENAEVPTPGLDDAINSVLGDLDLQSSDMTERGVRERIIDKMGIEELSKVDRIRIKTMLQHFIDEKSAEFDDVSEKSDHSETASEAEIDENFQDDDEVQPKRRSRKRKIVKIPKKRGTQDPTQPKRAITAFMYFSQARRSDVRETNTDLSFGEIAKLLGNMWKELPDEEKKMFQDKAEADKLRFDKEMAEWRSRQPEKTQVEEAGDARASKRKRNLQGGSSSKEDEAAESSESEVEPSKELSHIDKVLASLKSRRRRKTEISTEELEAIAPDLIERMGIACQEDEDAFDREQPATRKLQLLDEVERECRKQRLHEILLDSGILRRFRDWLRFLPDGSLPNLTLRTRIYSLLEVLPIDGDYLLESEGLGKILMGLWKNQDETPKNRQLLRAMIEKWSRPMFHADTDYRKIHDHTERNASQIRSRLAKLKSAPDRPMIRYQSHHAARPEKAVFDYSIMPQSRIADDDEEHEPASSGAAAGDVSRTMRIKKNIDRIQRQTTGKHRSGVTKMSHRTL